MGIISGFFFQPTFTSLGAILYDKCLGRRVGGAAPHQGSQHRGGRPCGEQIRPPGPNVIRGIRGLVEPKNWDSEISPRKLGMYQSKMVMSCDFMPTKLVKDQDFNGFHMISAPNSIEMMNHVLLANQNDDDE